MKHFFVRPIRPEDSKTFIDWNIGTKDNLWDPDVVNYKSTYTRCIFSADGPVLYAPVQRPMMLESLAFNPNSTELDRAMSMKEFVQDTVSQAYIQGSGELVFVCKEESTKEFAEKHGFKPLPYALYRMKLKTLEGK